MGSDDLERGGGLEGREHSQEENADHEVRVWVAECVAEELPLEDPGKAGCVFFHRLDEPCTLCVCEESGVFGILVGASVGFKLALRTQID